MQSLKVA